MHPNAQRTLRCISLSTVSSHSNNVPRETAQYRSQSSHVVLHCVLLLHLRRITEGPHRKESGKRGRKPGRKSAEKVDMKAKLERSRQSARECRARKKLRYQYLEELVADREKAVLALRKEIEKYQFWAKEIDEGRVPEGIQALMEELGTLKQET